MADDLAEAFDVDEAAESDEATEMELGPDDGASGRAPLVPWVTLSLKTVKISWFKTGMEFDARCNDPRHGRCALTRADRRWKVCRLDACLDAV